MNCPGHVQLFRQQIRSYRDLPVRFSEFGACHRYEPSGALHGIMRGRAFTQDDAHVFCMVEHIDVEVTRFCQLLRRVYARFGFREFVVGLSTRPAVREGSDALWDHAEASLAAAAELAGLEYRLQPGEGAFYGPKLEFILKDREAREWQCGTIQLDLVLPENLDAEVIDESGSLERVIAVLLEHRRGKLPLWLAPEQVAILPVSPTQREYAVQVADTFGAADLRFVLDDSNETLAHRIVAAHDQGVPVIAIVGAREAAAGSVTLRNRGGEQRAHGLAEAVAWLNTVQREDFVG